MKCLITYEMVVAQKEYAWVGEKGDPLEVVQETETW